MAKVVTVLFWDIVNIVVGNGGLTDGHIEPLSRGKISTAYVVVDLETSPLTIEPFVILLNLVCSQLSNHKPSRTQRFRDFFVSLSPPSSRWSSLFFSEGSSRTFALYYLGGSFLYF